ncbi:hypothetical protein E2562_017501 [Oryza meyeriana var. granulata]|uniref:Uncharacterized protein n=1 Tax=Oryza meyeriana var. granulata TaxID=110450 RepID=A0A6G1DXX7_9ORYZ|nr:hypothetical protein E2562_017501 [Oryza meyeriana var. granulata]
MPWGPHGSITEKGYRWGPSAVTHGWHRLTRAPMALAMRARRGGWRGPATTQRHRAALSSDGRPAAAGDGDAETSEGQGDMTASTA